MKLETTHKQMIMTITSFTFMILMFGLTFAIYYILDNGTQNIVVIMFSLGTAYMFMILGVLFIKYPNMVLNDTQQNNPAVTK